MTKNSSLILFLTDVHFNFQIVTVLKNGKEEVDIPKSIQQSEHQALEFIETLVNHIDRRLITVTGTDNLIEPIDVIILGGDIINAPNGHQDEKFRIAAFAINKLTQLLLERKRLHPKFEILVTAGNHDIDQTVLSKGIENNVSPIDAFFKKKEKLIPNFLSFRSEFDNGNYSKSFDAAFKRFHDFVYAIDANRFHLQPDNRLYGTLKIPHLGLRLNVFNSSWMCGFYRQYKNKLLSDLIFEGLRNLQSFNIQNVTKNKRILKARDAFIEKLTTEFQAGVKSTQGKVTHLDYSWLILGRKIIHDIVNNIETVDDILDDDELRISIIHHTPGWFFHDEIYARDNYSQVNYREIINRSHIILSGHEHPADPQQGLLNNRAVLITGKPLQPEDNKILRAYQIIKLNKSKRQAEIYAFQTNVKDEDLVKPDVINLHLPDTHLMERLDKAYSGHLVELKNKSSDKLSQILMNTIQLRTGTVATAKNLKIDGVYAAEFKLQRKNCLYLFLTNNIIPDSSFANKLRLLQKQYGKTYIQFYHIRETKPSTVKKEESSEPISTQNVYYLKKLVRGFDASIIVLPKLLDIDGWYCSQAAKKNEKKATYG